MRIERRKISAAPLTKWTLALLLSCLALTGIASRAHAADPGLQSVRERLDSIRDVFDSTEEALKQPTRRDRDLTSMRDAISPLRAEVRQRIEELEPRFFDTQNRLKEIGPAPGAGAPAEDARITIERGALAALLAELDGILKQAKLLTVRGDQLVDRIEAGRRTLFTERLLTRSGSILSPALWIPAVQALPDEARNLAALLTEWRAFAEERTGYGTIVPAILAIAALIVAILLVRRAILRRIDRYAGKAGDAHDHGSRNAYMAICRVVLDAATPPIATFASIEVLLAFDLLPAKVEQIATGLLTAVTFLSVGCAVTRAMLDPARQLISFDDTTSNRIYHSIAGAITTIAAASILYTFHRALGAPSVVRIATSSVMALVVGIFIVRLLLVRRPDTTPAQNVGIPSALRFLGWIAVAAIFTAITTGHVNLGSFIASRLVDAIVILAALVLLLSLVDSLFAAGFSEEGSNRRKVANAIGVNPARLDFLATLLAGILRALLFVIAGFLIIGGRGTSVTDVASLLDRFDTGFEIGQSRIALTDVLLAVGTLLLGLVFTRIVHRWLTNSVLPRATLETSLQNSIATMFVYIGVIVATLLALAQLGINLQNIALVAGALSVGIGFGLQSIVSNFVSGIILLAERPIRVGDIIVVKGEEGYVRRISVRATEIETFERANVIIPNSELVSNVVKNWTHANTTGRTTLKLGVSYDSNPEKVREILLATVAEHPQVMKTPEPRVLLIGLGDKVLEFELRCIITNIDFSATVRSDLYFAILRNFRAAGIEVPPKG